MTATLAASAYRMAVKAITYRVPSATTPGLSYDVSVNPLTMRPQSCTCPARRECWHRKAVAAGAVGVKPRITYGPVAVPPPASHPWQDLYPD